MDRGMPPVTTTITSPSASSASISGNTEIATTQVESSFFSDLDLVHSSWITYIKNRTVKEADFCNWLEAHVRVDVDIVDKLGWTPLIATASYGWVEPVKKLIAAGAFIDKEDVEGCTALLTAAANGFTAVVKEVIEACANVDHEDMHHKTALYLAAEQGHSAVVEMLIGAGANFDKGCRANYDTTPLFMASFAGKNDVVRMLTAAGANIDQPNSEGTTPLCIAAENGKFEAAKILIAAGANLEQANDDGDIPKELLRGKLPFAEFNDLLKLVPEQPFIRGWPSYLTLKNRCRHLIRACIHSGAGINQLQMPEALKIYIRAVQVQSLEAQPSRLDSGSDAGRRQRTFGQ